MAVNGVGKSLGASHIITLFREKRKRERERERRREQRG
jgi:hypothetical protein